MGDVFTYMYVYVHIYLYVYTHIYIHSKILYAWDTEEVRGWFVGDVAAGEKNFTLRKPQREREREREGGEGIFCEYVV